VFAAIVMGTGTRQEIAARTGIPTRELAPAIQRLLGSGLVGEDGLDLVANGAVFKDAVRQRQPAPAAPAVLDPEAGRNAVLRNYVRNGRLSTIPAHKGKRRVVLEHLVTGFEPGVRYPESAVNQMLNGWHEDHAALRRYLVVEGLMGRENGVYWRI
jgi:hypothetical protein